MIRRKLYTAVFTLALLTGLTGCSGWLDLKPESEILLDDYWKTESDVDFVLNACYRGMTEEAFVYRLIVWGELRSDNLTIGSGFPNERYDMYRILKGEITSTNTYSKWGSFYTIINYCNTILDNLQTVRDLDDNFTEADMQRAKAEALTIRALCYFYLVRTFKDVPWIEESSVDDTQDYTLPKESGDVILQYLVADLLEAQQWARTDFGTTAKNKGKITLNTVNALLADVYLWMQDYENCILTCDKVLADPTLILSSDSKWIYSRVFYLGNSTESIFELQFDETVQKNVPVRELYGYSSNLLGDLGFPATLAYTKEGNLLGAFSPFNYSVSSTVIEGEDDLRAKESYWLFGGQYFIFKYAGESRGESLTGFSSYSFRSDTPNWILYRLSDVILMKAEALVERDKNNDKNVAIELVNQTYLRSNEGADSLKITNYPNKGKLEKLVLRERQRELLFEGKRWFDLVRLANREKSTATLNDFVDKKASTMSTSLGVPVLNALYMPIAQSELEANGKLKQNPYYEEAGNSSSR
jgi:starch-binding outer membrane protein, SusD/RagB family